MIQILTVKSNNTLVTCLIPNCQSFLSGGAHFNFFIFLFPWYHQDRIEGGIMATSIMGDHKQGLLGSIKMYEVYSFPILGILVSRRAILLD